MLLVVLEVPAIIVAIVLHRTGGPRTGPGLGAVLHEVLLNRSVFLLLAGIAVGWLTGRERFEPFRPVFVDAFRPILAFFILEMGLGLGGSALLGTMAASASYIAAPAAVRIAIPEANTGLSIAASLGLTFPFNLAIGIPLYVWFASRIAG